MILNVVPAKLVKLKTADGLVEFFEDTPLGKVYRVDLDTMRRVWMYNIARHIRHRKLIINSVDDDDIGFIPVECLEFVKQ